MDFLKRVLGDKKEWKRMQMRPLDRASLGLMEARAEALPCDYRIVYGEIKKYMWRFTAGDGMDIVAILKDLLELFETGAADGKRALEITGEDVAAFCDELLRNANTYTEKWHEALNRDVMNKLQSEETQQ